jgi:hypothetical protein
LESHDIIYINKGDDDVSKAVDVVVVDQQIGSFASCDWAALENQGWEGDPDKPWRVCRMARSTIDEVATCPSWEYEHYFSAHCVSISKNLC